MLEEQYNPEKIESSVQSEWEKIQKEAIVVDESSQFSDLKSKIRKEFYKNGIVDPSKVAGNKVLKVSEDYEGKEYNLNNTEDFDTLRKETGQNYQTANGDDEMWVYMNGMQNNEDGVSRAKLRCCEFYPEQCQVGCSVCKQGHRSARLLEHGPEHGTDYDEKEKSTHFSALFRVTLCCK